MNKSLLLLATSCLAPFAGAQSLNVDFNWSGLGTVPTSSYAAAGLAGVWNDANVGPGSISNLALLDLSGSATSAVLNAPGFGQNFSFTGPWSGDDQALMEDLMGSGSITNQFQLSGLLPGFYRVTLYGQSATGNLTSTFAINNASQTTSGAWLGSHVLGSSYAEFTNVSVLSGSLAINWLGNCNGMQLSYTPVPEPMTITVLLGGVVTAALRRRNRKRCISL